jgi:hypothetical protein
MVKIKTRIMVFFSEYRLWGNVGKYGRARQATESNIALRRKDGICVPDNQGKNTDSLIVINTYCFPLQQWLPECVAILRHTYTACPVEIPFPTVQPEALTLEG